MNEPPENPIPPRDDEDDIPAHLRGIDDDPLPVHLHGLRNSEPRVELRKHGDQPGPEHEPEQEPMPAAAAAPRPPRQPYARIASERPAEEPPTFPIPDPLPPPAPAPPGAGGRRLRRSSRDKMLAGICGGLAEYANLDPTIVRLAFVVATVFGPGIPLYLLAWLVMPAGDGRGAKGAGGQRDGLTPAQFAGRAGIVIAAVIIVPTLLAGSALAAATGNGTAVAASVIAIGGVLVAAAFYGGARWLIPAGLVLALPLAVVSAADLDLDGGVGDRKYRPQSLAAVKSSYSLGMGHLTVDLRDVEFTAGEMRNLTIDVGVGEAEILVPEDVCVSTEADVGIGATTVFGSEEGGLDVATERHFEPGKGKAGLLIESDIGMGHLVVSHGDPALLGAPNPPRRFFDHDSGGEAIELQPACLSGTSA